MRLASANADTPARMAALASGPDAGVIDHATSARAAVKINPEIATAAPHAAAAAASRPGATAGASDVPSGTGRSGAIWWITPPLSHGVAPILAQARRWPRIRAGVDSRRPGGSARVHPGRGGLP